MALSFPASPTVNQTYTLGSKTWIWNGTTWKALVISAATTVNTVAPTSAVEGQMWYDTTDGTLYIRTGSVWLESVVTTAGASANPLPSGTTAQRPGSPVSGSMRVNSETNYVELYQGSSWFNLTYIGLVTATSANATVTYSGNYAIHTFLTSGTFTPTSVPVGGTVDYLVVAGGGGGGRYGGGGGGGGLIYATSQAVASGTSYVVTVGGGAPGWPGDAQSGGNAAPGINSTISAINVTAYGGGGGGLYGNPTGGNGANGGSGGGGGGSNGGATAGGTAIVGQGNAGGTSSNQASNNGGGGGGAGAAGTSGVSSSGAGGIGAPYTISGTSTYYAGGGSGNQLSGTLAGGLGGGGTGFAAGVTGTTAMDGTANTGGGGGGARDNTISGVFRAGNGGSGIVIIRYRYQ